MTNHYYVTTTIPYVNAPPHIGFACELVQADAIARYQRLCGQVIRFQTGTDENAFKNVLSARALGIPVQECVQQNTARFQALCDALSISNDHFIRTSEPAHQQAVQLFLARLQRTDVYQRDYSGFYCTGCEDFYLLRDLNGNLCPEHGIPVVEIAERNHFFRLSAYQEKIHELITTRRIQIVPESREAEVLRFIERGLTDISLSREAARSGGWGVPYPGDSQQVVYVWIDALINYLTGLETGDNFEQFWTSGAKRLHVIGKNVWKFHAIYWPALLLSAGLEVPETIFVHGFLTNDGKKISKTSGNGPDPVEYINTFGVDAVRYFLLRHIHPFEDTDFSVARLGDVYDSDLANGIGNLCSRLTTLCEAAELQIPARKVSPPFLPGVVEHVAAFRVDLALEVLWTEVRQLNQLLSLEKPWEDIAAARWPEAHEKLGAVVTRLDAVAHSLQPFLPVTASAIRSALAGPVIRKSLPLFPKRK